VKIIFVNRFFHPDHSATSRILSDIAFGLAERGFDIHVITSRQLYDAPRDKLPVREAINRVVVHRVWSSRFGRVNLRGRAVDYLTFYFATAWALLRLVRRHDIIVAKTDPPMLSVIAGPLARLRGAELVNWLQDVFPEVAQAIGVGRGRGRALPLIYSVLGRLRDRSLKRAMQNVVLGERMAQRLSNLGIGRDRIRIIANFADGKLIVPVDAEDNALRAAWGLGGKFVVAYSGNFGRAHEYRTLLGAMQQLSGSRDDASPNRIAWLFVGGGALYGELRREAGLHKIRDVRFEPYQPDSRLAESLSAADVHIVSLLPDLEGLIVPSKFYGIAAAGRPTIFIGDTDGEIARLLARHGCGYSVAVGDVAALVRAINDLAADPHKAKAMGERARRAFRAEFDKSAAIGQWAELLDELAHPACVDARFTARRGESLVRSPTPARSATRR
jgi:glycosyltransferase involved in cell wall biosynthesis